MRCASCGKDVVAGVFCTSCGAHQPTTSDLGSADDRMHSYAAHPGEHVLSPGVISTLFPHLGRHRAHEFRWALLGGFAVIFLLYVAGLIAAALLASAFLVPLIYLLYLYEAQIYKGEPASVIGFTIGGGAVLGVVVSILAATEANSVSFAPGLGAPDIGPLLAFLIALAVIQEIVKPLPALLLRGAGFPETIDGLTFGVAAGLGFSFAETIVNFSTVFTSEGARSSPGNWLLPLITVALLQPLMQASGSGLIAAAIWRMGRGAAGALEWYGVAAAFVGHALFWVVAELMRHFGLPQLAATVWQAAVVGVLLVMVRLVLHNALLEEGADLGVRETVCPNCHRHVMAAGFCPNCGKALAAAPATVRAPVAPASGTEAT